MGEHGEHKHGRKLLFLNKKIIHFYVFRALILDWIDKEIDGIDIVTVD